MKLISTDGTYDNLRDDYHGRLYMQHETRFRKIKKEIKGLVKSHFRTHSQLTLGIIPNASPRIQAHKKSAEQT